MSGEQIAQRVIKNAHSGAIVLLHNGGKHTPESLPLIFETLQAQGYTFVPISEIIYKDNYTIDYTGKQMPNKPAA